MSTNRTYAQGTSTDALVTQADIMKVLARFGVKQHAFMNDGDRSAVAFGYGGMTYRIAVLMPPEDHEAFRFSPNGRQRTETAARNAYEGEVRRRWRSLLLLVKAKLVAVDDEIATFEEEFMPYVVTDNGQTMAERMVPQLKQAALDGRIPSALALPGGTS